MDTLPASWPSATARHPVRRDIEVHVADLIRAERRPLPAHDLDGVNARAWSAAVCGAEIKHRDRDFTRACNALGVTFDRYADPCCVELGQFDHEAAAGIVLNVQGHLIGADDYVRRLIRTLRSQRGANWHRQAAATVGDLRAELHRRRAIWRQFLAAVERYRAARREHDRVPAREAA